jgi:hypothetical protein
VHVHSSKFSGAKGLSQRGSIRLRKGIDLRIHCGLDESFLAGGSTIALE